MFTDVIRATDGSEHADRELSRTECLELLAETGFGRVVVTAGQAGPPMIRPVNYVFDVATQSVAFRTAEGTKLHALVHSSQACFEIDALDPETLCGWSVIIVGRTEEVTVAAEVRRLECLGLVSSIATQRAHWVRIHARTVSGRRVAPGAEGPLSVVAF
jgi:nitroimidazol reductase NimA-like FMN-containing flavoprotein (pyridoxamine 5'-phosphate oxidase superfamily)